MGRNAKRTITKILTTLLVVMFAAPAIADLPGPGPRPHPPIPEPIRPEPAASTVPITIRVDPQAKESELRIPKQFLPSAKLGAIEERQPVGGGTLRHVIAALALSGAITGLFFVRRDRKTRAAVVILVCVCAIAAAGTLIANAAPPVPQVQQPDPEPNPANAAGPVAQSIDGKVIIKVTDDGTAVTLILSGDLAKSSGITTSAAAPAPVSAPAPNAPSPR